MAKSFDLLVIGDSTVDLFFEMPENSAHILCQPANCQLCFNYADKVPVKTVRRFWATGNAANFAVGAAKLGLNTGIYTLLGNDYDGKQSKQLLKTSGVDISYARFDKAAASNISTVISYKGERTILSFHQPRAYNLPRGLAANWWYFSSVADQAGKLAKQIINRHQRQNFKLVFNPGSLQLKSGLAELQALLNICRLLVVNKEEAASLLGLQSEPAVMLKSLGQFGPKMVVITDGQAGCWATDGQQSYFMPSWPSVAKDRTGAGDSFAAGLVSALAVGNSLPIAMAWGTLNAGSVVQQVGAHNGLLSRQDLETKLADLPPAKLI